MEFFKAYWHAISDQKNTVELTFVFQLAQWNRIKAEEGKF
jgi:hypothetical protein